MKVWVGQVYIKPGVNFPFSQRMQGWLSEELSAVSGDGTEFRRKYGDDFELMVRISADTGMAENRVKGPTVFKKTRDVEYVLFLPFDAIVRSLEGCRTAAELLVDGVRAIFQEVGIGVAPLDEKKALIVEHLCSEPTMLKAPWPSHKVDKASP